MWYLRLLQLLPRIFGILKRRWQKSASAKRNGKHSVGRMRSKSQKRKKRMAEGRDGKERSERQKRYGGIRERAKEKPGEILEFVADDGWLADEFGSDATDSDVSAAFGISFPRLLALMGALGVGVAAYAGSSANGRANKRARGTGSSGVRKGGAGEELSEEELTAMNDSTDQRTYLGGNTSVYDIQDTDQIKYRRSKVKKNVQGSGNVLNNVFNIRSRKGWEGTKEGYEGYVKIKGVGNFAVFSDVAYSALAYADLHASKTYSENGGLPTLKHYIHVYAPAADRNDPDAYVRKISSLTGIEPDDILDFKNNKKQFVELARVQAAIENSGVQLSRGYLESVWEWKYNNGPFPAQTRDGKEFHQQKVLADRADGAEVGGMEADAEPQNGSQTEQQSEANIVALPQTDAAQQATELPMEPTDQEIEDYEALPSIRIGRLDAPDEEAILRETRKIYISNETTTEIVVDNFNPNGI